MKIGRFVFTIRKVGGHLIEDEIFDVITHPEGDVRQLIAKMSRASAKDYLDKAAQDRLDIFNDHLQSMRADLKSDLDTHARETVKHLVSYLPSNMSPRTALEQEVAVPGSTQSTVDVLNKDTAK